MQFRALPFVEKKRKRKGKKKETEQKQTQQLLFQRVSSLWQLEGTLRI
jgi:hypothetical protein